MPPGPSRSARRWRGRASPSRSVLPPMTSRKAWPPSWKNAPQPSAAASKLRTSGSAVPRRYKILSRTNGGGMATWDDVARIAAGLPELEAVRPREWRVRKKLVAWERPLRKADLAALGAAAPEGPILGVRTPDVGVKEALLADDPDVFFTTPHF